MATRQTTTREADVTPEQGLEKATTVYRRLRAQGRPEADARRDAERWVKGNFALDVTLPAPEGLRYGPATVTIEDVIAAREAAFTSATESYSHFASAATAVSEKMANLIRIMAEDAAQQRADGRREDQWKNINPDITRLQKLREQYERRANEAWESGDMVILDDLQKAIKFVNRRIEWHREQIRNA